MLEILRSYARFVVRHAWLVLLVSLALSALVSAGLVRLKVELDPENQLPADHPYIVIDKKIRKEFGGKQFVAIALVPRSGDVWTKDVLTKVHALTGKVLDAPGVIRQNVVSLSSPYVRIPVDRGGTLTVDYLMRDVPADDAAIGSLRDRYRSEPLFKGSVVSEDEHAAMVLVDFYDDVKPAAIDAEIRAIVDPFRSPDVRIALTGQPILENHEGV